jgi:hypothetical protein
VANVRDGALLLMAFGLIAGVVFGPGLSGPLISDDVLYLERNPYVADFTPAMLPALFDPSGDAVYFAGGNYAPVHVLAHALERRIFRDDLRAYHLVNIAIHSSNAVLLALLLVSAGISRRWATIAAALFLVHPANVEAVVWISQLKSLLALGFALAALLVFRRFPLASTGFLVLGLLSKATAAFALPFALARLWSWHRAGRATRRQTVALGIWVVALAVFAVPQLAATSEMGSGFVPEYPDLAAQLRTIFAIGARYLAMAATGYGTSAFHEPGIASEADPWWWAGLAAAALIAARSLWTLREGREEAAWWLGAIAAFAPISQWIPFYFGMADRYLYFILPGLIGAAALVAKPLARRLTAYRRPLGIAAVLCMALLGTRFVLLSMQRSELWTSETKLLLDASRRYPDGGTAHFTRALIAMRDGDPDEAMDQLHGATERGYHFIRSYQADALLAPLADDPRFVELIREIARRQIAEFEHREHTSQQLVIGLSQAYFLLGDLDHAIEILELSAREGGPLQDQVLHHLLMVRRERAERRRDDGGGE